MINYRVISSVTTKKVVGLFWSMVLLLNCNGVLSQDCNVSRVFPSSITFGAFGETQLVSSDIGDDCISTITGPSWIRYSYNVTGEGYLLCEENTGEERTGIVYFGDNQYPLQVTQAAVLSPGTISGSKSICNNGTSGVIAGSVPTGGAINPEYSYQWEKSTTSTNSGFSSISGATGLSYTPGSLTTTTYFRRKVTCGDIVRYSNTVTITVYPVLTAGSIGQDQNILYNTASAALTQTTAPVGGSGIYTYQWQSRPTNGSWSDITGATSTTYTPATMTQGSEFRRLTIDSNGCGIVPSNTITISISFAAKSAKSENYIYTITPNCTVQESLYLESLPFDKATRTISYYDGLGRLKQNIIIYGSPTYRDIVTPVVYDNYGREELKYLPYSTSVLSYGDHILTDTTDQKTRYNMLFPGQKSYSKTVYENSPLNRVIAQGAPGNDWQPETGHPTRYDYETNSLNEVILWSVNAVNSSLVKSGYYVAQRLYKTIIKDENWSSGTLHTTEEFKDLQGNVVLKRSYIEDGQIIIPVETYYVYDDLGLLRYVLPPEAIKNLGTIQNLMPSDNLVKNWCYYYEYDARRRMTVKQLPGAEPVYMVYDNRDRLVAVQDGNLRKNTAGTDLKKWLITKYDCLNRPVLTGTLQADSVLTQKQMQARINRLYSGSNSRAFFVQRDASTMGYTDSSFPMTQDGTLTYLTATYYDNYSFPGYKQFNPSLNISEYSDSDGNTAYFDNVVSLVTGTKVLVLDGGNTYLTTTTYYDDKYRPIQILRDLYGSGTGGLEVTSNNYDFIGQVLRTQVSQTFNSVTTTVNKYFSYDHMGRLLKEEQEITGDSKGRVTISQMTYNELGQLIRKDLHKTDMVSPVQNVDYSYNIRGWLTSINNPDIPGNDLFTMRLYYNENTSELGPLASTPQYNGNIAAIKWLNNPLAIKGYGFTYDGLNRLTGADFGESTGFTSKADRYNETLTYDLNGNIKTLSRSGYESSTYYSNLDVLNYCYDGGGNKLTSVTDAGQDNYGFVDVTNTADYSYDNNGNLIKDLNKGIATISYNYLNLPSEVIKDAGNKVMYIYDATGSKLCRRSTTGGTTTSRYYTGLMEYNGTTLDIIHNEEGLTYYTLVNGIPVYEYEYYLKDHLGNIRNAFTISNNTAVSSQYTEYYPYGMVSVSGTSGSSHNDYLYNGKELQRDLGMEWYDYGARFYDPQIGRFTTQDPMAESHTDYTQYHYAFNNPIAFIDPFGLDTIPANSNQEIKKGDVVQGDDGQYHTMNTDEVVVTDEAVVEKTDPPATTDNNSTKAIAMVGGTLTLNLDVVIEHVLSKVPALEIPITFAGAAAATLIGSFVFLPGDTPIDHDAFAQHGKNRGTLSDEELSTLKAKKEAKTLTGVEKQKLKRHEKNTGERPSRQSKDKKK